MKLLVEKGNKESKEYLAGKGDQHEDDPQHLEDAKQSGLKMIAENNHWIQIDCAPDDTMRSIESIHEEIYTHTKDLSLGSFCYTIICYEKNNYYNCAPRNN